MGVMPLTALKEATAPKAADAAAAALRVPRDLLLTQVRLTIHRELATVEHEWRRFEQFADCTVFQTFDWLSIWQNHIGQRHRVKPAIVVGRFANGDIAFLLPFCIERHYGLRRLRWLGQDLCDYNAPLLACDFTERVEPDRFLTIWQVVEAQIQAIRCCATTDRFCKNAGTGRSQINPFTYLKVTPNASGVHLAT